MRIGRTLAQDLARAGFMPFLTSADGGFTFTCDDDLGRLALCHPEKLRTVAALEKSVRASLVAAYRLGGVEAWRELLACVVGDRDALLDRR